jgi:hypothetical protein
MMATVRAAHAAFDRAMDNTERALLSRGKVQELERKRVDRMIKELYDEIYGRDKNKP